MERNPIVIIGAGPVGLLAALRLEILGLSVIVLEKNIHIQNDLRASTFHPPTLEMLDELDLTSYLISKGLKTNKWQIRMHESNEKVVFDLNAIANDTKYPFRLQLEQSILCEAATEKANDKASIDLRMGNRVIGIVQNQKEVSIKIERSDGSIYKLKTPYLLATDGANSTVRKELDLRFEGHHYPETTILVTTKFPFHEHLNELSNVNYIWCDDGTFSLLRLPTLWRCSLYAKNNQTIVDATKPSNIEDQLQKIVPMDSSYEVIEIRPYRIHQRILENYRVGRIVFAGDAAHINSPSGGMGMNGGIHDIWNLTSKLASIINDNEDIALLDLYSKQRQPIAKEEIIKQAHQNRTRMQEKDKKKRRKELTRLQNIVENPIELRKFLLRSSMIDGLKKSQGIKK